MKKTTPTGVFKATTPIRTDAKPPIVPLQLGRNYPTERAMERNLEEVLATADYVTLHIPENEETRGMFGAHEFTQMKPSAYFINSSRGGVVQEEALIQALQEQRLAGAALEVRQQEPAAPSAFDAMDNVIQLPHIGAQTREAQHRVVTAVCKDVAAVLHNEAAKNFANFSKPIFPKPQPLTPSES